VEKTGLAWNICERVIVVTLRFESLFAGMRIWAKTHGSARQRTWNLFGVVKAGWAGCQTQMFGGVIRHPAQCENSQDCSLASKYNLLVTAKLFGSKTHTLVDGYMGTLNWLAPGINLFKQEEIWGV